MSNNSLRLVTERDEIELAYVEDGNNIFLVSSGNEARWPSKILREGKAVVTVEGRILERGAQLVSTKQSKDRILKLMSDKYGRDRTDRWFSLSSKIIELNDCLPDPEKEDIYSKWLEAEFDSIASNYDEHIFGNEVNYLLRERSLVLMEKTFDRPALLLEIGSGTGTETIELLKRGHHVIASDVSSKMLEIVKQKARNLGLESQLDTMKVNGEQIESLIPIYGEGAFDGIYSTYGAINCIRDLSAIPRKLHSLLNSNGKLVMGIYNRFCVPEIGGYLAKFKPRSAFNRLKNTVQEGESRFCIDVFAYSMPEILRLFDPYFKTVYREGVPVIILPSNFVRYVRMFGRRFENLKRADAWLGRKWPFSMLGDHFLMVMKPLTLDI
jgi:SAM-dependent methyltransferase